jgi:hypothetical protein
MSSSKVTQQELFNYLSTSTKIDGSIKLKEIIGRYQNQINVVDIINDAHRTLLHAAARAKNHELIIALLACGADANVRDSTNETVLHDMARYECPEIMTVVRSADMYAANNSNSTPMHIAIVHDLLFNVKLFVNAGFDISRKFKNETIIEFARRIGNRTEIVTYLESLQKQAQPSAQPTTARFELPIIFRDMWKNLKPEEKHERMRKLSPEEFAQLQNALGADF